MIEFCPRLGKNPCSFLLNDFSLPALGAGTGSSYSPPGERIFGAPRNVFPEGEGHMIPLSLPLPHNAADLPLRSCPCKSRGWASFLALFSTSFRFAVGPSTSSACRNLIRQGTVSKRRRFFPPPPFLLAFIETARRFLMILSSRA